jgi:6-phosphogluconolactonase
MKRSFLRSAAFIVLTTLSTASMAKSALLYIATQNPDKPGITVAQLDTASGALATPRLIAATRDPAHFTVTADGRHLYMCNTGTPGGVSAFAIKDRATGELELLNYKESRGRGPSYVSVDGSGRYVLDANYGGGYVEVLALVPGGALGDQTAFVQHEGSSVHARQNKPYAHWIRTDPSNRFALAADLGTDQIVVYRFDAGSGKLSANEPPAAKVTPGSGPRHLAFHPNGKWVYAVQELSNEVVALEWDAARGALRQFQAVRTLAPDFSQPSTAAEIAVRRDGRFVYVSNRGEDTLVVYAVDAATGELTLKQRVSTGGKTPRYFDLDPSARWLVVANQEGGSLRVFAVDADSGELRHTGNDVALDRPMGVVFLPR